MRKILIVDDETDVEQLFRQRFRNELRSGELEMKFVFSARQALDYMSTLDPFDIVLVLSDINMPGMNGLDLLKEIRKLFPELFVFMITAYGDKQNHDEALKLGARYFLTKPVDFQLLKQQMENLTAI